MLERRVKCPQCRREIRLGEAELADKRGFCAFCDARFELLPDHFLGNGPLREVPLARAQLTVGPPPSVRLRDESPTVLLLRPMRALAVNLVAGVAIWLGALALIDRLPLSSPDNIFGTLFPLLWIALGSPVYCLALWALLGWERVEIADGTLRVRRGLAGLAFSTRTTRVDGTLQLNAREGDGHTRGGRRTIRYLSVASVPDPTIRIGNWIGLDPDDFDWLKAALAQRVAAARP
jgi:hypothetical protein